MSCLADGPKLVSKEKRNCVVQDCILNILIEKSVHGGAKHLEHCHVTLLNLTENWVLLVQ
jgi:hypothetical protein